MLYACKGQAEYLSLLETKDVCRACISAHVKLLLIPPMRCLLSIAVAIICDFDGKT